MDILNDDTQKIPFMYITISCWNVFTINLINQPFKFNKLPKVVKPTNSYKTLGTCLIYKPMSLPPQVEMKLMHSLIYLALISPYVSAFKRVFLHSCHKSSIKKRGRLLFVVRRYRTLSLVINLPRTYEKLHYKQRTISVKWLARFLFTLIKWNLQQAKITIFPLPHPLSPPPLHCIIELTNKLFPC